MEVKVEEPISTTDRGVVQPVRSRQLMKLTMIGQHSTVTGDCPRVLGHNRHHVGAVDTFHDHVETVVTDSSTAGTGNPWERT